MAANPIPVRDDIVAEVTASYLDSLDVTNLPELKELKEQLFTVTVERLRLLNSSIAKDVQLQLPSGLTEDQIYQVLNKIYNVRRVACSTANSSPELDILCVYQNDGPDRGLYTDNSLVLSKIIRSLNRDISARGISNVMDMLRESAPRVYRTSEPNLIAVNNGIFDYDTKTLMDFSPDYVFLSKSRVDYNPNATNVTIHNDEDGTDWDVESWMRELSDDPEIVQLLWEILGAVVRPFVPWNKSAWFYSNKGNNGKGTLCSLMRNLVGKDSYASVSLSDFSKEFMLEPLVRSTAIIVDENDVGVFIDKAANLKAVVTGDVIQVNRKFKPAFAFQFHGFMIQCLNEFPRIKDKSDSFYRRQLFVPFEKCFTGRERKYIKTDYLQRQDVLEYVLKRVLNMDYYQLSDPAACREALSEYKEFNDPVLQFLTEVLPEVKWNLLPYAFLYDLYKSWYKDNIPMGKPQSKSTFQFDLRAALDVSGRTLGWYDGGKTRFRSSAHMIGPEPLIAKYDLTSWYNPNYKSGSDVMKRCLPDLNEFYSGIMRYTPIPMYATGYPDDD